MKPSQIERLRLRWINEVADAYSTVDPQEQYTWEGVLLGFLLGAGVPLEQARLLLKRAPSKEWPIP